MNTRHANSTGFTLVETLVAILALTLSLGALTVITSRSVASARDAEMRMQAELLALEGVEVVQQKIMSLVLSNASDPFSIIKSCGSGCKVEYSDISTTTSLVPCLTSTADCATVENNSASTGLPASFASTGSVATSFRRILYAKPSPVNDQGAEVRVVVWYGPSTAETKHVVLNKEIRPWYTEQIAPPSTP